MGIRTRFLVCLLIVLLPLSAATLWNVRLIDSTVRERIESALADSLRLEAARILETLSRYVDHAEALAGGEHVRDFISALGQARRVTTTDSYLVNTSTHAAGPLPTPLPSSPVIGGIDGFAPIDPAARRPLTELADRLRQKALTNRSEVVEVRIVDNNGRVLGESDGYDWEPRDASLPSAVMTSRESTFGEAYRVTVPDGTFEDRLGLVAPVIGNEGVAVGALLLETRLAPVVDLVQRHEALGSSSEAHIAQPTTDGDAEFITLLRFERDAAFNKVVPQAADKPINRSLATPLPDVLRAKDYRGADSILAIRTLEPTGWGLVVKVDTADAFAPVADVHWAASVTGFTTLFGLFGVWWFVLRPIGDRLELTSAAAALIFEGRLEKPIADQGRDEIGGLARTIDRLASDLDTDRAKRGEVERRLRHQATHDELTGLSNRKHAQAIIDALSETPQRPASIVFLDLDGFKQVNDRCGHAAGDEVLVTIAERLEFAVEPGATLARWGGDEFVVILPDTDSGAADATISRVRATFDDPVTTHFGEHALGCSIGSSTSDERRTLADVVVDADARMYVEKNERRDYGSVDALAARAVQTALDERRVELWLQPITTVLHPGRSQIVGAEALVRLRSRDGGVIPPDDFLAAIRKAPLGRALDHRVLTRSIEALARWRTSGVVAEDFCLSVNVTGASLREPDFAGDIGTLLARHRVPASRLIIEISEKTGDFDPPVVDRLRSIGVEIALDDVGLQRSNIDRLVAFAPDVAKIDRQWLDDEVVLPRLVDLCRSLGMRLVAEGVENEAQLARLQALSVTRFQGFLFDRPRPAVQFVERWGQFAEGKSAIRTGELLDLVD